MTGLVVYCESCAGNVARLSPVALAFLIRCQNINILLNAQVFFDLEDSTVGDSALFLDVLRCTALGDRFGLDKGQITL